MDTYRQLTSAGTSTRAASGLTGISRAAADRDAARPTPVPAERRVPANALTPEEKARVLAVLDGPEFVDAAPAQVYAGLLDQGVYVGSISTMYRVLREHAQVKERRRLARHPARTRPELVATGPGQVYAWDITKLKGPVKGCYLAKDMMREVFGVHGIPHVVHADRGTAMTSKTVADLLEDLAVTRSTVARRSATTTRTSRRGTRP